MKKILTFAPREIGDTIMSTPLYFSLKEFFPSSRITLISESVPHPVLEGLDIFDAVIPYNESLDLKSLRAQNDLFVLPVLAGGRRIEKHFEPFLDFSFKNLSGNMKRDLVFGNDQHFLFYKHQVELNMDLAKLMGFKGKTPPAYCFQKSPLQYEHYKDYTGIYINTPMHEFQAMANRAWPLNYWEKLILELKNEPLILLGGPTDFKNLSELSQKSGVPYFVTPTIGDFTAVCQNLSLIVGAEGGAMHAAATTGVPVVALFSKASPILLHPWISPRGKCISVLSPNACSPCDRSYNLRLAEAGWGPMDCLRNLMPLMVKEAVIRISSLPTGTIAIKKGHLYFTKEQFLKSFKRNMSWLWSYSVSRFLLKLKFIWGSMSFAMVNKKDIELSRLSIQPALSREINR